MYKQLKLPKDSAWDRKTWRYYTPIWFNKFVEGIVNIFVWIPILYKDKNWDYSNIYSILEFKLLQQRKCLVQTNRFVGVDRINRDITICLNLINRLKEDYYEIEHSEYFEYKHAISEDDFFNFEIEWENFDEFFKKYPNQYKAIKAKNIDFDKLEIASQISRQNQIKAKNLLYRILNERLEEWWD